MYYCTLVTVFSEINIMYSIICNTSYPTASIAENWNLIAVIFYKKYYKVIESKILSKVYTKLCKVIACYFQSAVSLFRDWSVLSLTPKNNQLDRMGDTMVQW